MFVIPCKFDAKRPVIFECVEAIQKHHDNPKIVVVDSASDDKSYLGWCHERGCEIADIDNHGYANGAFAWATQHYDADYFYLIFDSLIVQSNLDKFRDQSVTTVRHWPNSLHDWGWDYDGTHLSVWGGEQLGRMNVPTPSVYNGIYGPMMFVQRTVVNELAAIGYWDTQVTSVYLQCAMERVTGITLEHLGYLIDNSIQGVHTTHRSIYDETFVRKIGLARA